MDDEHTKSIWGSADPKSLLMLCIAYSKQISAKKGKQAHISNSKCKHKNNKK